VDSRSWSKLDFPFSINHTATIVNELRFYLSLSPERYLHYYRGAAKSVVAQSLDGKRVAFPAERLRPFVTRDGVHGLFSIRFDTNNRFVALERLGDLPPGY